MARKVILFCGLGRTKGCCGQFWAHLKLLGMPGGEMWVEGLVQPLLGAGWELSSGLPGSQGI
jgi:hypothetical protein